MFLNRWITRIMHAVLIVVCLAVGLVSDSAIPEYSFVPIKFSGYTWLAVSTQSAQYPGPNFFSNSSDNVWVDPRGSLHLKITYKNGAWRCPEIFLPKALGYGTYEFQIIGDFTSLDVNAVTGLFLFDDNTHEYDIEFSRWGNPGSNVLNYTVQPVSIKGNIKRFPVILHGVDPYTTHQIRWSSKSVEYLSFDGHYDSPPTKDNVIADWQRSLKPSEDIQGAQVHINFWLVDGEPPGEKTAAEIIISGFKFIPL